MSRDRYAFAGWLRARASNGPHANHFHSRPVLRGRVRNRWVPALRTSCEVFVWLGAFSPSGSPNAGIRGTLRGRPGSTSVAQSRGLSWHTGAHRPLGCGPWDETWDFYPTRSRNLGCLETHLPRRPLAPQLDYHLRSWAPASDDGQCCQRTLPG